MNRILTLLAGVIASMAMAANVSAQNGYEVKGVVIDQIGPVVGATVMEAGTSNGVSTDLDGNFILKVSSKDAVIEVSCIGYTTQTFTASQMPATVSLEEDTKLLEESVVIGYGTVRKADLAGSVAVMDSKQFKDQPITRVEDAL